MREITLRTTPMAGAKSAIISFPFSACSVNARYRESDTTKQAIAHAQLGVAILQFRDIIFVRLDLIEKCLPRK